MTIRHNGYVLRLGSSEDQVYSLEDAASWQWHWNVTEGLRLAQARGEVLTFSPRAWGITVEHLWERYPALDAAYAPTTDLKRPLLFVPHQGTAQLIDGWHRLVRPDSWISIPA